MIEDMQDELQVSNAVEKPKASKKTMLAFVLLFWLFYAGVFAIIFTAKIETALSETNFFEILKNYETYSRITDSKMGTVHFVTFESKQNGQTVACETLVPMTGATTCHDFVEGLLQGPSDELLAKGYTSCLNKNVQLLGLTVSNSYAFVSLSDEYLECDSELARKQILCTLQMADSSIEHLIILIDGQEILDTPC